MIKQFTLRGFKEGPQVAVVEVPDDMIVPSPS